MRLCWKNKYLLFIIWLDSLMYLHNIWNKTNTKTLKPKHYMTDINAKISKLKTQTALNRSHSKNLKRYFQCHYYFMKTIYLEHIQSFWISQESVAQPWYNLVTNQSGPYCIYRHSPWGLLSQKWGSIKWASVLCNYHIHKDWASRFFATTAEIFGKYHITQVFHPWTRLSMQQGS